MSKFTTQDEYILNAVKDYREACTMERFANDEKERSKAIILAFMEANATDDMTAGQSRVKVKEYFLQRIDTLRFKREEPELAKKYIVETKTKRFTVQDA